MTARTRRIALVRPGPSSLDWLVHAIKDLQGDDPLQPVTVVAPSPYLSAVLRQRLAESGCANVRLAVQLRPIAERIGRARGSRAFDQPLTGPLESAAIRVAVHESGGALLQPLAGNRALQESLGSLFRELGHLDDDDPALDRVASSGSVGAAAGRTYHGFAALTRDFPDVPRQLRIAARLASESPSRPPWAEELGPLVLYLPGRIDAAEMQFLSALARHVPVALVLAWLDDAEADRETQALCVPMNVPDPTQWRTTVHVLSAPDPEEETRTVVRRVLADVEDGAPLWRMAILYASDEPYAALVRETLDSAGVPWHAALGRQLCLRFHFDCQVDGIDTPQALWVSRW